MVGLDSRQSIAFLAATLSLVSVQIGASVAKTLFPVLGPETVALVRLGIAAILLCVIFRPWQLFYQQTNWRNLVIYGMFISGMNVLVYKAFAYMSVGLAISIEVLGPLTVAMLMSKRKQDLLWAGCALIGIVILPLGGVNQNFSYQGMGLALAAAICWGLYIIYGRRVASAGGSSVAVGMLVAALCALPVGFQHLDLVVSSYKVFFTCVFVSLFSSMIPFLLDIVAMKRLAAHVFGMLLSASPAISAVAAWCILGEALNLYQILAIIMIMVACIGCSYASYREKH
ncbi:EamA family transporter [Acinetobacter sp. 1000160]|jgi:inner membrane transporter RhtA|uniref:EamA family transporter n=1 Tax=Acinetobacter sp. 1000160 TaxID=1310800 RepID=UPI000448BC51|nr:EamA family transporter [Acinetobacter sp. 1000160]EXB49508.1 eamA-like transporter family protein [Acinetobacter baumannii 146457]